MRLETARLVLDPLTPDDAPALAAIAGHPAVAPMLMIFPSPCPEDVAASVIARSGSRPRDGVRLAIREGGALRGSVGVGGDVPGAPASLAFFLAPEVQGRGLGREAATAFVGACFEDGLPAIHADQFEDNAASGRLLDALGFETAGRVLGRSAARPGPAPMLRRRIMVEGWESR